VSDGDFVYSTENSFGIWGTPVKTCLICIGTPVKIAKYFGSRNKFKYDLLRLWEVVSPSPSNEGLAPSKELPL